MTIFLYCFLLPLALSLICLLITAWLLEHAPVDPTSEGKWPR